MKPGLPTPGRTVGPVLLAGLAAAMLAAGCARIESGIYSAGLEVERTRAGLDEGEVDTGQEALAYLHREGPGPTLVLLHGFASNKDIWIQLVQELPDDYAVLIPDLPGHGDSSRELDRDYRVGALAEAVNRALDVLETGPVHLAGSSLGGAVALAATARRPDQVLSLALFNPAGAPDAVNPAIAGAGSPAEHPLIVTGRRDLDAMVDLVFHDPPPMPWPIARVLSRMHAERAELHHRIWTDIWEDRQPAAPLLQQIDAPVLLVWGERDRVLDQASVDFFRAHLADLEVVLLPDSGHTPILEEAEASARLYAEFLDQVEAARVGGTAETE